MHSGAYTGVSLRIILAVIGTWVVILGVDLFGIDSIQNNKESQLVLAFCIGLLPKIVLQALAELSKKFAGWLRIMESLRDRYPITQLDGLTVWHASRFEEEDLENIPGMATADIMELMIRTRFSPDRIVEWVDQAILLSQLLDSTTGDKNLTGKLKKNGIRTATGLIVNLYQEVSAIDNLFANDEKAQLLIVGRAIRTKPNLLPILRWRGISESRFKALPNGCDAGTNSLQITTV